MALVPPSLMAGRNKGSWAPAFPYRLDPSLFVSFNLAYIETVIKQWYLASPPTLCGPHTLVARSPRRNQHGRALGLLL